MYVCVSVCKCVCVCVFVCFVCVCVCLCAFVCVGCWWFVGCCCVCCCVSVSRGMRVSAHLHSSYKSGKMRHFSSFHEHDSWRLWISREVRCLVQVNYSQPVMWVHLLFSAVRLCRAPVEWRTAFFGSLGCVQHGDVVLVLRRALSLERPVSIRTMNEYQNTRTSFVLRRHTLAESFARRGRRRAKTGGPCGLDGTEGTHQQTKGPSSQSAPSKNSIRTPPKGTVRGPHSEYYYRLRQ